MATLLLILIVLALVHVVYETIIAPTLRLRMKYRFFELRDQAVLLRLEEPKALPDPLYQHLLDAINGSMCYISDLSLMGILRLKPSEEERLRAEQRIRELANADAPEVRQMAKALRINMISVLVINSTGMLLAVIPIIVFVFTLLNVWRDIETLAFKGSSEAKNSVPPQVPLMRDFAVQD